MQEQMPAGETQLVGASIETADDKTLGQVVRVLGDYFCVRSDEDQERWFGLEHLVSNEGRLVVSFREDEVLTHEVPAPDATYESQYLKPLSPEQAAERELMLRQLAEQREQMHEQGVATEQADETVGEPVEQELHRRPGT